MAITNLSPDSQPTPYLGPEVMLSVVQSETDADRARAELPEYDVHVVKRWTVEEETKVANVGTIWRERVLLSDNAVRDVTRSTPDANMHGRDNLSPFVISATDALCTGPDGFNNDVLQQLTAEGFPVVWFHHQGRHGKWADMAGFLLTKSVGRSAHHQHALLDDLARHDDFVPETVFSAGDSRGSMIGEAVEALAPLYDRRVAYGDYIAGCFEHAPSPDDVVSLAKHLPSEGLSILRIGHKIAAQSFRERNPRKLLGSAGTFDLHPKNLAHEAAWVIPLMSGETGRYIRAVPLDAAGKRTTLANDLMSQAEAMQKAHASRPGISFDIVQSPDRTMRHVDLADPVVQLARAARFGRLLGEMQRTDFDLTAVDYNYVTDVNVQLAE